VIRRLKHFKESNSFWRVYQGHSHGASQLDTTHRLLSLLALYLFCTSHSQLGSNKKVLPEERLGPICIGATSTFALKETQQGGSRICRNMVFTWVGYVQVSLQEVSLLQE